MNTTYFTYFTYLNTKYPTVRVLRVVHEFVKVVIEPRRTLSNHLLAHVEKTGIEIVDDTDRFLSW